MIPRGYHQLPRYRENKCTDSELTFLNTELRYKNPSPKDRTERWSSNNEYPIGTVHVIFFSSVHTAETSTGPAMLCI